MSRDIKNINYYELIQKKLTERNKTIYVLKGFGDISFKKYALEKLYNLNFDLLIENNKVDMKNIGKEVYSKLSTESSFLLSYEEFVCCVDKLKNFYEILDYHICIINNNFYHNYYPLSSIFNKDEVKSLISDNKDHIINRIFDEYVVVKNKVFIEYSGFDEYTNISFDNLFETEIIDVRVIDDINNETYSFGLTEETYLECVLSILERNTEEFNILIDSNDFLPYQKNFLSILNYFGVNYNIVKRTLRKIVDTRIDGYLKILKRKNSNYEFRHIEFYKNPGFSLDTVKISQSEIISSLTNNALNANNKKDYNDIFVTAPTGSGKSILFQIPAIYLAEHHELLTIIISPLIGLMNDQVQNIQAMTTCAATINSEYTPEEKDLIKKKIINKEVSILYISPETLLSNNPISNLIGDREIGLMVIDESHIVSTWGKSFRPDYWFLGDYISYLRSKHNYRFPIATFSATITYGGNDDMHGDIIDSLKMKTGDYEYIAPMRRDDITFDITLKEKESDYLKEKEDTVIKSLNDLLLNNRKTIAYFPFTSQVNNYMKKVGTSLTIGRYYGSLSKIEKNSTVDSFKNGDIKMMLATKAFGMGIDIDDVEVVYHYAPTGNLCDYVQEIGRAARNENIKGIAKTDFFENDYRYIKQLFGMSSIKNYQLVETLKKIREIYLSRKERNFTVSPDEFSYIFPMSNDMQGVDNLFKTVMLMIQKDFEKNPYINFKPLVFKPKSMFTKGYFLVKPEDLIYLKRSKYIKYFTLYSKADDMATNYIEKTKNTYLDKKTMEVKSYIHQTGVSVKLQGDIYIVNFKQMWEENYNELSFAKFKYQFHQGELKDFKVSKKFLPEYLLTISVKTENFENAINKLESILNQMIHDFSKPDIDKTQITVSDIASMIENNQDSCLGHYESMIAAENFIKLVNNYQTINNFGTQLVFKKNQATERYTITSINLLKKRINTLIQDAKEKFSLVLEGNKRVLLLNLKGVRKIETSKELLMAQFFEMFRLAMYQVVSGERPEYFIRINSITEIEKILDNKFYQSEMVRLVKNRHDNSIVIMNKFFTELNGDKERWDYIEQYFAGFSEYG